MWGIKFFWRIAYVKMNYIYKGVNILFFFITNSNLLETNYYSCLMRLLLVEPIIHRPVDDGGATTGRNHATLIPF